MNLGEEAERLREEEKALAELSATSGWAVCYAVFAVCTRRSELPQLASVSWCPY